MALTPAQQTAILAAIQQEGGLANFANEVAQLYAQSNSSTVLQSLTGITVAVTDWTVWTKIPDTLALDRNVLLQALQAIQTAITNQNATNLGPLFVALFVIAKRQAGV